ncbi:hypothetical protein RSAG8_08147, partial [Rhizoctonia solani AG-8 WAC10335]
MASIPTLVQAWRLPIDRSSWNGHKSLELREVKIFDAKKWPELLSTLAKPIAPTEFKAGPKLTAFWNEITARDGFKKVYAAGLH